MGVIRLARLATRLNQNNRSRNSTPHMASLAKRRKMSIPNSGLLDIAINMTKGLLKLLKAIRDHDETSGPVYPPDKVIIVRARRKETSHHGCFDQDKTTLGPIMISGEIVTFDNHNFSIGSEGYSISIELTYKVDDQAFIDSASDMGLQPQRVGEDDL
jgi:hypothetical protein